MMETVALTKIDFRGQLLSVTAPMAIAPIAIAPIAIGALFLAPVG